MTAPDFDEPVQRIGTHSLKWDSMQAFHGVAPEHGIPMWVADMDFRAPEVVRESVAALAGHGVFGYYGDDRDYLASIRWWMKHRHQWDIEDEWVFSTHGLVNGTAMCVEAFSDPGDAVVLMTPVYHAFAKVIRAAGRQVCECPLQQVDGRYEMDLAGWQKILTGREKIVVLCSPHNPGGRVWSADELAALARFCEHNDLILVSDEIHHDLVFEGHHHTIMANAAPDATDRIIVLSAATKTFNLAGAHIGNVIIADPALRQRFAARMAALGMSPNAFGLHIVTAAYSEAGAQWVDALLPYLQGNCRLFDDGISQIAGARSMTLESTYLAWVDFSGTGLSDEALADRVRQDAKIAVNLGPTFGSGGQQWLRFNLATQRVRIEEAVARLQRIFANA